jgi:hypothetical protein
MPAQAGTFAIGSTARVRALQQVQREHTEHDLMTASHTQLLIDVFQVEPHGTRREPEALGDFGTILIAQDAADDVGLSWG